MKLIERIVVNGKVYKLQHPGNRAYLEVYKTVYDVTSGQVNLIPLLDYCFEHVVFPDVGGKIKLDDVDIKELSEVWGLILPSFLRGDLSFAEGGYIYPENEKSKKEGIKLLQNKS